MTVQEFEEEVVRHISRCRRDGDEGHILCATPYSYYSRQIAVIIRKHFPDLEIGGPAGELAGDRPQQVSDAVDVIRPFMVGSIAGMCLTYLRARLSPPGDAGRFRRANALVVNYDAGETGQCRCILADIPTEPVASIRVNEFLAVYKDVTSVAVEFPPCLPRWDYEHDKPIY